MLMSLISPFVKSGPFPLLLASCARKRQLRELGYSCGDKQEFAGGKKVESVTSLGRLGRHQLGDSTLILSL